MKERVNPSKSSISRRSFLGKSLAVGAGTIGAGLLANVPTARASGGLTSGDAALISLLAAAELISTALLRTDNRIRRNQHPQGPRRTRDPARNSPPPGHCY